MAITGSFHDLCTATCELRAPATSSFLLPPSAEPSGSPRDAMCGTCWRVGSPRLPTRWSASRAKWAVPSGWAGNSECPRWPRRNSLGVGGGRRANLLAHRFALGVGVGVGVGVSEQESGGRWGGVRGSLRRCAESTGLSGSLPVQLGAERHRGLRHPAPPPPPPPPLPLPLRLRRDRRAHPRPPRRSRLVRRGSRCFHVSTIQTDLAVAERKRKREMVAVFGLEDGWMDGWMDGWNCRDVEWLKRCRI